MRPVSSTATASDSAGCETSMWTSRATIPSSRRSRKAYSGLISRSFLSATSKWDLPTCARQRARHKSDPRRISRCMEVSSPRPTSPSSTTTSNRTTPGPPRRVGDVSRAGSDARVGRGEGASTRWIDAVVGCCPSQIVPRSSVDAAVARKCARNVVSARCGHGLEQRRTRRQLVDELRPVISHAPNCRADTTACERADRCRYEERFELVAVGKV